MGNQAPAGWYSDGTQPGYLRWWDGTQWTNHMRQIPAAPPPPAPHPLTPTKTTSAMVLEPTAHYSQVDVLSSTGRPWWKRKRVLIPTAAFVGLISLVVVAEENDDSTTAAVSDDAVAVDQLSLIHI